MIYTIADLHLPLGIDKPMDVFGSEWDNYVNRLDQSWRNLINQNDTVIIPGDLSWATYLEQAIPDFNFLQSLPGKKIISKGNHDYWWETITKLNNYLKDNSFDSVQILHNNSYLVDNIAIAGNRGWSIPLASEGETYKIYMREIERLKLSLQSAKKLEASEIIVFTHYPPVTSQSMTNMFTDLMDEYNVKRCFYGHLHGESKQSAITGTVHNTNYTLISADALNFKPLLVN